MKHRKHRRHRHPDSSDDDNEDDGYFDDHGHFHSKPLDPSELPSYNHRPPLRPPTPAPEIRPYAHALAQKEMLKLLSGMFSWNQFLCGEKLPKCPLDASMLDAVRVRKLESSWKCSVTRRAALSISEATQNKDLDAVYAAMVERRHLMDHARNLAHHVRRSTSRLPPLRASSSMEEQARRSGISDPPAVGSVNRRSASDIGSYPSSQEHDTDAAGVRHQRQMLSSMLLLNDDMLVHEAQSLLHQCEGSQRHPKGLVAPSNKVVEEALLRHRSLSPLMETLHPRPQRRENHKVVASQRGKLLS